MALNNDSLKQHVLVRAGGIALVMLAFLGLILIMADYARTGAVLLVIAGIPAVWFIAYEVNQGREALRGQRGSAGTQVVLQVLLATGLLIGINAFSFRYYWRSDWTRDNLFTLAPETQEQLRQLKGETTIVVYERHKTFGRLSDRPDRYDYAAERKVVEKVKDLVEQFREFGPQFKVVDLDVEEEGFDKKYDDLTKPKDAPPRDDLRKALDDAPENSIFFYTREKGKTTGNVQRMSFNAFYQLDKTASKQDNDGKGNLVLRHHDRGVDAFARRVLNIDMKRPKVAILVVHELLSTHERQPFSLKGLGTSLVNNGFDVIDILLKKDLREPVVRTFDESKFEDFEDELKSLKASVDEIETEQKKIATTLTKVDTDDDALAEVLGKISLNQQLDRLGMVFASEEEYSRAANELKEGFKKALKSEVPAEKRKGWVARAHEHLERLQKLYRDELAKARRDEVKTTRERDALNIESAVELRRMSDLTAKLKRLLADCDLVIIPRFTVETVIPPFVVPNEFHQLDRAQIDAVKSFMADGKPVLACFGPPADPRPMSPMQMRANDGFEDLLGQLDIKLGRQTILFKAEAKALASAQQEFSVSRVSSDVPPVEFEWDREEAIDVPGKQDDKAGKELEPNQIRESMRLAERSVGGGLDLQVRYGRPLFYTAKDRNKLRFEPEFMITDRRSWNEDRPFPMGKAYRPTPPKEDGPRGTLESKGNGPFTLGVAIEKRVPLAWYGSKVTDPARVRVAVIGHGGVFAGGELAPAKEKLLLDTCNWLLGRDDLLARDEKGGLWKFPRLESFSDQQKTLWGLGLPALMTALVICSGLVVLMVRHLR